MWPVLSWDQIAGRCGRARLHVTRALEILAAFDHGGAVPAFAGGTSLSKGSGLIKRFSKDIDFKVGMPACTSRSQEKKGRSVYRERVLAGLTKAGFVLGEDVLKRDESSVFSAAEFSLRVTEAPGRESDGLGCRSLSDHC